MSYASTAHTGSLGRHRSSSGFGRKVGAAVLTVVVGAAIAAGIAFTSSDVSSTSNAVADADTVLLTKITGANVNSDADTVLLGKSTGTDVNTDADRVLTGRKGTVAPSEPVFPPFSESPGQPR